jgi:hypothetical protein
MAAQRKALALLAREGNRRSLHCATPDFLCRPVALMICYGEPHTWSSLAERSRKSGVAPVGMTILSRGRVFPLKPLRVQQNCHPDRSEAQWRDLWFPSRVKPALFRAHFLQPVQNPHRNGELILRHPAKTGQKIIGRNP